LIIPLSLEVSSELLRYRAWSLPLRKCVFDVVQGGVDQDTAVIPSSRLDPDGLVNQCTLDKRLVGDGDCYSSVRLPVLRHVLTVLAQESDIVAVGAPDDVLDGRGSQFSQDLLLLDIKQEDGSSRREDKRSGTTIEDVVGLDGALDSLDDVVGQITSLDVLWCQP
jgi:hypothetical protein